jgi:hypothetical protein
LDIRNEINHVHFVYIGAGGGIQILISVSQIIKPKLYLVGVPLQFNRNAETKLIVKKTPVSINVISTDNRLFLKMSERNTSALFTLRLRTNTFFTIKSRRYA